MQAPGCPPRGAKFRSGLATDLAKHHGNRLFMYGLGSKWRSFIRSNSSRCILGCRNLCSWNLVGGRAAGRHFAADKIHPKQMGGLLIGVQRLPPIINSCTENADVFDQYLPLPFGALAIGG